MNDEIKKCPFCAYDKFEFEMLTVGDCEHQVMCTNCGASGPNSLSKNQAIKSWNVRREVHPSVSAGEDAYEEISSPDDYCGECHRPAIGDRCQQCGLPLCPMCAETGAGFCKKHPDEHFEGYGEPPPTDAYEDLRNATPKQLLDATIWYYRNVAEPPAVVKRLIAFLRLGFQLAQPGGWERVAPMWLRESQKPVDMKGEPIS